MRKTTPRQLQSGGEETHLRQLRAPGKQTRTAKLAGAAHRAGAAKPVQRKAAPDPRPGHEASPGYDESAFLAALGFVPGDDTSAQAEAGADTSGQTLETQGSGPGRAGATGGALQSKSASTKKPVTSRDSGVLSAAAARRVLDDAYGAYKGIDAGQVRVLAQAEFQAAYDEIYGDTEYSWDAWVVPTHGNLNGFAYDGVNYINAGTANITTVPHEILHNNAADDWRPFVGSSFDEGATEYLEQHALRRAGIRTKLTHYPKQRGVVEAFLASGQAESQLFEAYFRGGARGVVGQWVDSHCQGSWNQVQTAMEQSKWATARACLQPK